MTIKKADMRERVRKGFFEYFYGYYRAEKDSFLSNVCFRFHLEVERRKEEKESVRAFVYSKFSVFIRRLSSSSIFMYITEE